MKLSFSDARRYLFYLFVFSLPWQTRWIIVDPQVNGGVWEYGRVSVYGWDILLVLLLLLNWRRIVHEVKLLRQAAVGRSSSELGRAFLFSLLFVAYVFFSSTWARGSVVVLVWAMRLLLAVIGGWLLVRAVKPKFERVLLALAAAGTVQAVWAVWQFVAQVTFASKWLGVAVHPFDQGGTSVVLTSAGRWLRAYAGQVHPNVLGGLLAVTLLATAWLIVHDWKKGARAQAWLWFAYLVQVAGLFASFSRGAWLALGASFAIWWWRRPMERAALRLVTLAALGIFIILSAVWWHPVLGRLAGGSRLEQQSVDERVGGLNDSRQLLSSVWWRGEGLGGYTAALIARDSSKPSYAYQPVHNVPLLALTELGLVGFLLLLAALWARLAPFSLERHLLLLPVLFTSLFDHYWWTVPSMLLLAWLVAAISEAAAPPGVRHLESRDA